MKHYTVNQLMSMPDKKLQAHLNRQVTRLLAEGIPVKTIKQILMTTAEITLRMDEGRLSPGSQKPASAKQMK